MEIAEFLLARIAEDEAVARAVRGGREWQNGLPATIHPNPETYRTVVRQVGHVCGSIIAEDAEHIARWDPARVLAECEAKRRIVGEHPHRFEEGDGRLVGDRWSCQTCHNGDTDWWCPTLRLLALPYADHPDYREEWRP